MPVRLVAKQNSSYIADRERLHLDFNRVIAPFRVSGHENRISLCGQLIDEVLLQVRLAVFIPNDPSIEMANCIRPRAEQNAPIREVMVFLDRSVELSYGMR